MQNAFTLQLWAYAHDCAAVKCAARLTDWQSVYIECLLVPHVSWELKRDCEGCYCRTQGRLDFNVRFDIYAFQRRIQVFIVFLNGRTHARLSGRVSAAVRRVLLRRECLPPRISAYSARAPQCMLHVRYIHLQPTSPGV